MSHNLGRLLTDGRTLDETDGIDLVPGAGSRFLMLHFDNVNLSDGARLTVELGYDTDVFNDSSGADFWSRPVDAALNPIPIRISGGSGSA